MKQHNPENKNCQIVKRNSRRFACTCPTTGSKGEEPIEKAYPDAYRLARAFHNLYEENAPKFGYGTRKDTKEFDPASPNGRLMAFVCKTIVDEEVEKALDPLTPDGEGEFVEAGANIEHERWARWYLWEKQNWSLKNEVRWDRQANTPYADLSESEKESDRREVRSYLPLLRSAISRAREEGKKELKFIGYYGEASIYTNKPNEVAFDLDEIFLEKARREARLSLLSTIREWVSKYMMRTTAHYGTDKHGVDPDDLGTFLSTLSEK